MRATSARLIEYRRPHLLNLPHFRRGLQRRIFIDNVVCMLIHSGCGTVRVTFETTSDLLVVRLTIRISAH
jgi:hypothetical protein